MNHEIPKGRQMQVRLSKIFCIKFAVKHFHSNFQFYP